MKIDQTFDPQSIDFGKYYYIIHTYDRVLIGNGRDNQYQEVLQAVENNRILEAHFFNDKEEIFVVREGNQLVRYAPLVHRDDAENVITREYSLEKKVKDASGMLYDTLVTKEYISYDQCTHLAYVEQTILYKLEKKGG